MNRGRGGRGGRGGSRGGRGGRGGGFRAPPGAHVSMFLLQTVSFLLTVSQVLENFFTHVNKRWSVNLPWTPSFQSSTRLFTWRIRQKSERSMRCLVQLTMWYAFFLPRVFVPNTIKMFTIKPSEGIVSTSFSPGDKFFITTDRLLPVKMFTEPQKRYSSFLFCFISLSVCVYVCVCVCVCVWVGGWVGECIEAHSLLGVEEDEEDVEVEEEAAEVGVVEVVEVAEGAGEEQEADQLGLPSREGRGGRGGSRGFGGRGGRGRGRGRF